MENWVETRADSGGLAAYEFLSDTGKTGGCLPLSTVARPVVPKK